MTMFACSREQTSNDQSGHVHNGQQPAATPGNTIMFTDAQVKLANITTQKASMKSIGQSLMVNGVLRTDETRTEVISSRAAGRIERLYVRQTGVAIKKGEPLYEMYSEVLLTMQKEYLLAKEQNETLGKDQPRYASYVKAAERKLLLYGLTQSQVNKLGESKKPGDRITFLAPAGGIVAEVSAVEGQYVDEGTLLFKLDDISKLWAEADMYPNELRLVKKGDKVSVTVAGYETSPVEAEVGFVSPEYRGASQMTVVRAFLTNSEGNFRPGMQAQFTLNHSSHQALSIPVDAVIRDGKGSHVYIQTDVNTFEPRKVKTGVENFEQVEITDGLAENEVVAITGAYLLYSEFKNQNKLP